MKFIVGSKSDRKVLTIKKVIADVLKSSNFSIEGYAAESGVPSTPREKQTFDGATNRATDSRSNNPDANFYIGIESGLVNRYGIDFEETWCCITNYDDQRYYGYSSGLKIPDYILSEMKRHGLEHYALYDKLGEEKGIDVKETWGTYTGGKLLRSVSLEEAARNALLQIFAPDGSFYKEHNGRD